MKTRILTYKEFEALEDRRNAFIDALYRDSPYPTQGLRKVNTSCFHAAVVTEKEGNIVAQAILYHNAAIVHNGQPTLLVGNYECVNDDAVANHLWQVLFETASKQASWLIGPMNGNTWSSYRFGLDSNLPLFFTETLHHDYYPRHFRQQGFEPLANYASYLDTELKYSDEEILNLRQQTDANELVIRPINPDNLEEDLREVHAMSLRSFQNNFLYSPISFSDFYAQYEPVRPLIDPNFCRVALDGDKVVAVFFVLKDLYDPSGKTLIIKTIARLPERRYAATVRLMAHLTVRSARENGYSQMIHAFMHVENTSVNVSRYFSGQPYKRYQLYVRHL